MPIVVVKRSPEAHSTHLQQASDPSTTYCGEVFKTPARVPSGGYVSCTLCARNLWRAQHRSPYDDPLTPRDEDPAG